MIDNDVLLEYYKRYHLDEFEGVSVKYGSGGHPPRLQCYLVSHLFSAAFEVANKLPLAVTQSTH